MRRAMLALAALCLATAPTVAQEDVPEGLLYCAHFDEHGAASWAAGSRAPTVMDPRVQLIEGVFGNALSLPHGQIFSIVANDGNFRPDQGTIELWLRPNWDGDDGQVHVIFGARVGKSDYMNLNKLDTNTFGVATGGRDGAGYQRVELDISDWEAGQWHHIAATWGEGRLALSIDGEQVGEAEGSMPPSMVMPAITFGPSLDGAIDELAIWSFPKAAFDLSGPIAAPELGEVELGMTLPPPVTDLDRYEFELPDAPCGYHVVPKYYVDEVDPAERPGRLEPEPSLRTFAARGEWQTLGLVLYATSDLADLTFTPRELEGPRGASIPAGSVEVRLNRRVMQKPRPRVGEAERRPAAALLDPANPFDLPAGHFKEAAITIHVPGDAAPGQYRGDLAITCEGGERTEVPIWLEVLPFSLEPSERKAFGMYYDMPLAPEVRDRLRAELQDLRDHHVTRLFSYLKLQHDEQEGQIVTSYDEVAEGLSLLQEFGFHGEVIVMDEFRQIARLLGHEDVERGDRGESLAGDEQFAAACERAIRGLEPLRERYPEFEIVLTHMDEVMGEGRRYLYINLARPVRRVPEQRIYITMHTLPVEYVPEATAQLDPWMDIRCYNGHALDLYIQAGGSWEQLAAELEEAGDEGWMYYNPHRVWYTAEWSRIINSVYFWTSPLTCHCPYRYRTMRTWPLPFIHNMAYTVMSPEDFVTPISTRNWEGFRLGAQDAWYFCMLEDLVQWARERGIDCGEAEAWLDEVRDLMPTSDEVQSVSSKDYAKYPVVSNMADDLAGADYERVRRRTADLIIELRERLGR